MEKIGIIGGNFILENRNLEKGKEKNSENSLREG
jgi:hypothetical protein